MDVDERLQEAGALLSLCGVGKAKLQEGGSGMVLADSVSETELAAAVKPKS